MYLSEQIGPKRMAEAARRYRRLLEPPKVRQALRWRDQRARRRARRVSA